MRGGVTEVIVWYLDRLYRQPPELENLIGRVLRNSVWIETVQGGAVRPDHALISVSQITAIGMVLPHIISVSVTSLTRQGLTSRDRSRSVCDRMT